MGISASIAHSSRKYRTNELPHSRRSQNSATEAEEDNEDDLASVSSFRPSSPLAHQDARAFTLDPKNAKLQEPRQNSNRHGYNYRDFEHGSYVGTRQSYQGSLEPVSRRNGNGSRSTYSLSRGPGPRALVSQSTPSLYTPVRTMRDVREYLMSNPDLLAGKKNRALRHPDETDLYGLSNNRKQMKIKQGIYMGLINPPIIYAMGARPDERQLKVDQKLYLNLVYPTMKAKQFQNQAVRSRPPLKPDGMVVVRKDDNSQQPNGNIRRPMPQMQVSRLREPPAVKDIPELPQWEGAISSTSQRSRGHSQSSKKRIAKRASSDYTDFPRIVQEPLSSRSVKSEQQSPRYKQRNGFVTHEHSPRKPVSQVRDKENDEVVFTFNVDDLNLKKKRSTESEQVVPLYYKKSLPYRPSYEYRA
ncbi:uncharacterized protein [Montipora foliosa]|uniref:uncharacterized protein n=1 Tax=Montipora foliosa TaxID=591990 RepID=UPI0035F1F32F